MASSGTTNFAPAAADLIVEAYSRIGIRGPALDVSHIVEARRSLNLILQDWSLGRGGPLLWGISLLNIPIRPGVGSYTLPSSFIQILDVYARQFTMATTVSLVGGALTETVDLNGAPVVAQDGQPIIAFPPSGVFDTVAGSATITMHWPAHGQSAGNAFEFETPVTIGAMTLSGLQIVQEVIDSNTLTFEVPTPAALSLSGTGGTALYYTQSGSATITVILDNHGFTVGESVELGVDVTVGGLTLDDEATIVTVPNFYSFTFTAPSAATSTAVAFANGGQIGVSTQQSGIDPIDIILGPLSRTDYASIPDKFSVSQRPTSFWLDRVVPPVINVWPLMQAGQTFALGIYYMRQLEDANPVGGQTLDLPNRYLPAISASLAAALAEKFAPEQFMAKVQYAEAIWNRVATEDAEHVPIMIVPGLEGYWR